MAVLAGLDDTTVLNYKLYRLSIPTVSSDNNGNVTFDDGIYLTSPEPDLGWWLPGTLQLDNPINLGGAPISATVGEAGQVVILDFCAVFPLGNLLGGANLPCRLTLTTSSLYIVPPTKGQPINR